MSNFVVSSTVVASSTAIFACQGKFISADETNQLIIKPHSIELLDFDKDSGEFQVQFEIPMFATIIGATAIRPKASHLDQIAIVCSDLAMIVLSFENGDIHSVVSPELRHDCISPSKYAPLFASNSEYLVISIYPSALSIVSLTESKKVTEIHFDDFLPKSIVFNGSSLLAVDSKNKSIVSIDDINSLLSNTQSLKEPLLSPVSFPTSAEALIPTQDSILVLTTDHLYRSISSPDEGILLPFSSSVTAYAQTTRGLFLATDKPSLFMLESNTFRPIQDLPIISGIIQLSEDALLLCSRFNGISTFSLQSMSLIKAFDGISFISSHSVLPHSVFGLDKLYICSGNDPSSLSSFALGYHFTESVRAMASLGERVFHVGSLSLISLSKSSVCLDESHKVQNPSLLIQNEKTLSFTSFEDWMIQITPTQIRAFKNDGEVITKELNVQHISACESKFAISASGSSSIDILNFDDHAFNQVGSVTSQSEISCISLSQNSLIVATWSSGELFIYNSSTLCQTGTLKILSEGTVVRSICEVGTCIFAGTSRGEVFCFSGGSCSKVQICATTLTLTALPSFDSPSAFVSCDRPGIVQLRGDSGIDFFPISIQNVRWAAVVSHMEFAFLLDDSVSFGSIGAPSLIELQKYAFDRNVRMIVASGNSNLSCLTDNSLLDFDCAANEVASSIEFPNNVTANHVSSFNLEGKQFSAVCFGRELGADQQFENGYISVYSFHSSKAAECTIDLQVCPTASSYVNGNLVVAWGSSISIFKVNLSKEGGMILNEVKKVDGRILATSLCIEGDRLLYCDIFKSASIYKCSDTEFQVTAVDHLAKNLLSGCFIDSGSIIIGDHNGAVFCLSVDECSKSMTTFSRFSIGEPITTISKWSPVHMKKGFCATTANGSVILLEVVSGVIFEKVAALQKAMGSHLLSSGALSHQRFRDIVSPYYSESHFGYIDADLFSMFWTLSNADQEKLLDECRMSREELEKAREAIGWMEVCQIKEK